MLAWQEWHISSQEKIQPSTPVNTGQRQNQSFQFSQEPFSHSAAVGNLAADLSQPILLTPDHFIALSCNGYRSEGANIVQQLEMEQKKSQALRQELATCQSTLQMYRLELQTAQTLLAEIIKERFSVEDTCWLAHKMSMFNSPGIDSPDRPFVAPEISARPIATKLLSSSTVNCAPPSVKVKPSLCQPETHMGLPKYDGHTELDKFKEAFAQCAELNQWSEQEQVVWLKEVLLTGDSQKALSSCAVCRIDQVWNILEYDHLYRKSTASPNCMPHSSPRTRKLKICKNCGGPHPPYACLRCVYCSGFHYNNRCPHKLKFTSPEGQKSFMTPSE